MFLGLYFCHFAIFLRTFWFKTVGSVWYWKILTKIFQNHFSTFKILIEIKISKQLKIAFLKPKTN
jgi:hypothetical protein